MNELKYPVIALTGGGTGGHLAVALSLALELKSLNIETIYIGSTSGQDMAWFDGSDVFAKTYFLRTSGVVNKKGFAKLASFAAILKASVEATKILKNHRVSALISVGGFSAAPASFGAISRGIRFFIHEQNAKSGTLNTILKPFAKRIFNSFEKNAYPYPVAQAFFTCAHKREKIERILFLGGSQGARTINDLALSLAKILLDKGIALTHQCGEKDFERVSETYKNAGILEEIDLFAFSKDMPNVLSNASLCVSRAGASSLWETCANGLPCFFIPYPHAHKDHQYFNALSFVMEGLASMQRDDVVKPEHILEFIEGIHERIAEVSSKLTQKINPNGAKLIVQEVLDL